MTQFRGFIGGSYQPQTRLVDAQRTVNLYEERYSGESPTARAVSALYPAPGFKLFSTPQLETAEPRRIPLAADAFDRPDGPLTSATWGNALVGISELQLVGGQVQGGTPNVGNMAYWQQPGLFAADQYSQAIVTNPATYVGLSVRAGAGYRGYGALVGPTTILLQRLLGGPEDTTLLTGVLDPPLAIGDLLRLEIRGAGLRLYRNNLAIATASDARIDTGAAGLYFHPVEGSTPALDSWEGGNLGPPPEEEGRGIFAQNDRCFAVLADKLYEIYTDGTYKYRPLTILKDFTAAPTVTPSTPTPALVQPTPPTLQQGGIIGTTVYGYRITGVTRFGESIASIEATIVTGYAVLDPNNFNHITWDRIPNWKESGQTGWKVYRTTGGTSPPKMIGEIKDVEVRVLQDYGQAGIAAVVPEADSSASPAGLITYGYKVTADLGAGHTTASPEGSTVAGYPLDQMGALRYNTIKWEKVESAHGYRVWRTTGGTDPPKLIGVVLKPDVLEFKDIGTAGEKSDPPTDNSTLTQTLSNDGSPIRIASSGDAGQQLALASSGNVYVYDLKSNVFALALIGATFVDYIEGYFVALDVATSTFKISGLLQGFSWPPLEALQRTSGGDKWLAMTVNNKEVWLIGSESTELVVNTGAPSPALPFAPIDSVFIQVGIAAVFSLMRIGSSLLWLHQDRDGNGMIVKTNGYGVERVSTHAVERAIKTYGAVSNAEAFSYQEEGHTFYVLSFPTVGRTWVLDLITQQWHERGHWDENATDFTIYRPRDHAFAFGGLTDGKRLVIDRQTGWIYLMSVDLGQDVDGRPIRRLRRAAHVASAQRNIVHDELELVLETGLGLVSGQGRDPTLMLRWSDDAGASYGHEHWKGSGALGARLTRVRWLQLGSTRDRVYELTMTDGVPWRIVGAEIQLRPERH